MTDNRPKHIKGALASSLYLTTPKQRADRLLKRFSWEDPSTTIRGSWDEWHAQKDMEKMLQQELAEKNARIDRPDVAEGVSALYIEEEQDDEED